MPTRALPIADSLRTPQPTPTKAPSNREVGRVKVVLANVREGPGGDHPVLATVRRGEQLTVLQRTADGWLEVELPGGQSGWIYFDLVSLESAPSPFVPHLPQPAAPEEDRPEPDSTNLLGLAAGLPGGQVLNAKTKQRFWILQEAIEAAEPGAVLVLGPGRYPGRIVLHKPLSLFGAGMDKTSLEMTRSSKDSFWIAEDSTQGRISHLEIVGGRQGLPVLEISGTWNGVIDSCRIRGGRGVGVLIGGRSTAALRRCEFVGTGDVAIEIRDLAQPRVWFCSITEARGGGIAVLGDAKPFLNGNRIVGAGTFGLQIGDRAQPNVQGNEIRGCRYDGVYVFGQSAPTLQRNQLIGNAAKRSDTANLSYDEDAAGLAFENVIEGAERRPGVLLTKNAHPILESNQIRRNRVGIQFEGRSFPTLKDNRLEDNGQNEVDRRGR
jgi:parallel beta-helix repeat protein